MALPPDDQLEAEAVRLAFEACELLLADDTKGAADRAHQVRACRRYLEARAVLEAARKAGRLPIHDQRGNAGNMVDVQRVRVSGGKNAKRKDPLVLAANAKGLTLRSLAEVLKVSHALLSQARKGTSSIDKALADRIAELTGFAATKAHWPKIRS